MKKILFILSLIISTNALSQVIGTTNSDYLNEGKLNPKSNSRSIFELKSGYHIVSAQNFNSSEPLEGWTNPFIADPSQAAVGKLAVIHFLDGFAYCTFTGSEWELSSFTQSVNLDCVVDDYSEMRETDESELTDKVLVKDFTYVFNIDTFTTIGGLFYKADSGLENGSTVIVSDDGTIWKRLFNGVEYIPEWYEVGGYDVYGNSYVDSLTSPDGVVNDNDRLRYTSTLAGENKVIQLGSIVKQFDIDINVPIYKNQTWNFNGVSLRRKNSPSITGASNSATTVNLGTSPTGFRVGQSIILLDPSTPFGGQGFTENSHGNTNTASQIITNISGTTITVNGGSGGFGANISNGIAMVESSMLGKQVGDYGTITLKNGYFDGNATNGGNILFTNPLTGFQSGFSGDWRYNYSVLLGTSTSDAMVDNCVFINTPAENITLAKGTIQNSKFTNLGGSFVHISSALDEVSGVWVGSCRGIGSNLIGDDIMTHSEATITFSARPYDCKISGCDFRDGNEDILGKWANGGAQPSYEANLIVSDSHFRNYRRRILQVVSSDIIQRSYFKFNDNDFINCGFIEIQGTSPLGYKQGNGGYEKIAIKNNLFVNTRIEIGGSGQIAINGNEFYYDPSTPIVFINGGDILPSGANVSTTSGAWVNIGHCDQVDFSGNKMYNYNTTLDEHRTGVALSLSLSQGNVSLENMLDDLGVETEYYYMQNVNVNNNIFWGFRDAIRTGLISQSPNLQFEKQSVNWAFMNNKIVMSRYFTSGIEMGIETVPGSVTENNTIWLSKSNVVQYAIWVQGIDPDGSGNENRLLGSIVKNNIIIGTNQRALQVGGTFNQFNNIVENNLLINSHAQALFDGSAGNSFIGTNTIITSTELPSYTAPEIPAIKYWQENSSVY